MYAENLSAKFRALALEAPSVWKYQKYRHHEILGGFLPRDAQATIQILDEAGQSVTRYEYGDRKTDAWWDRHVPVGAAPIIFNNRQFGTVRVKISQGALLGTTGVLLLLSAVVGVGLGVLAYIYPVRVATGMEAHIQDLIETIRRSNAESERLWIAAEASEQQVRALNVQLEERVLERTTQLAEREQELREAKGYLEHLIASSPVVIFRGYPGEYSLYYISPNVERLLGYAPEEVLGVARFWLDHIHPEYRERFLAQRQRVLGEGDGS